MANIAKLDTERRIAYGWANIVAKADGSLIEDSQGDLIEPGDLEDAAVAFMLDHRAAGQMHEGRSAGAVVECFVASPEKYELMGVPSEVAKTMDTGLWIAVKVQSDEAWEKVKSGEYRMFSIEGTAQRVPA